MSGPQPVDPRGVLKTLGVIRLVRTRMRRGAVEHFYTATVRLSVKQEPVRQEKRS